MSDFRFELEVYVDTRPNLRHETVENDAYLGRNVLECLFDRMEQVDDKMLTLSYPERWLNLVEQRQLFKRIEKYCPNMEKVIVLTHSVYIIQCTPNTCCKVFREEDDIDCGGRLYSGPKMSFLEFGKLNVLGVR